MKKTSHTIDIHTHTHATFNQTVCVSLCMYGFMLRTFENVLSQPVEYNSEQKKSSRNSGSISQLTTTNSNWAPTQYRFSHSSVWLHTKSHVPVMIRSVVLFFSFIFFCPLSSQTIYYWYMKVQLPIGFDWRNNCMRRKHTANGDLNKYQLTERLWSKRKKNEKFKEIKSNDRGRWIKINFKLHFAIKNKCILYFVCIYAIAD